MSFLTPLYIAGLLAVALPVLFHLIRRTPQGRQTFSSLMFLSPSPPRVTRRSRLNNILLLLLRATALSLLAFAFARPLLRQEADLNISEQRGRRIALLVDTSASMQRDGLWQQALEHVDDVLRTVSPADEVALYSFDRQVRDRMTFGEWNELDVSRRVAVLRGRLAELAPTWASTQLGDALASVADALSDAGDVSQESAAAGRQLVLITDLQQGSHVESLQGYQWPESVLLDVKTVEVKKPADAALVLVRNAADAEEIASQDDRLRVRVSNEANSNREQFTLTWANAQGPLKDIEPVKAYVPAGTSRIVRLAWPPVEKSAERLVLEGDDHGFDNTLYLVPPRSERVRVVYVGNDAADDVQGLRYFLSAAIPNTPRREVELIARTTNESLTAVDLLDARLVVVADTPAEDQAKALANYVQQGGLLLLVMQDAGLAKAAGSLLQTPGLEAEEAAAGDYALLGQIAFDHPLFAPFADPRFADFTRIRFWKHRRVKLPEAAGINVLAAFDNGDPFLIERTIGQGRVLMAAAGWHPKDSQLALSTKFVPLVAGLIERPQAGYEQPQHFVFQPIELPQVEDGVPRRILDAEGKAQELPSDATTAALESPGIYRLAFGGREVPLAVNLEPDESRTAPLAVEDLEARGARLGIQPTQQELARRERQLRLIELENRQKLWRWLIVGVLAVLILETALAGRLARRNATQPLTA